MVNAANLAIQGISALPDNAFPSADEKARLLSEARCFRGYANLHLLWLFGRWFDKADSPYGIIYRDQIAELSNLMADRVSVGESYDYIISDLEDAGNHLGDYASPRHLSSQFAKAMLAKLYLVRGWDGDYTNRISGIMHVEGGNYNYALSILKSADGNPDSCRRYTFAYENPVNGEGHFIHTYKCDGNPLPSFEGEPKRVEIPDDMEAFAQLLWNSLNEENKVSLFVRYIDIATGASETKIINKNQ